MQELGLEPGYREPTQVDKQRVAKADNSTKAAVKK